MQVIYDFELPKGYVDADGMIHKRGKMRLATARDEISAAQDPRVRASSEYLPVILLSQVITEFEGIELVTAGLIESLFTADVMFLQDMYERINDVEPPVVEITCPSCGHIHTVPVNFTGEG